METRKVQVTGGSSYIITLPKAWVKEQKIKKNHTVGISSQTNGELVITPHPAKLDNDQSKSIHLNETLSTDMLYRILLGVYVMGYQELYIKTEIKMTAAARNVITHIANDLIGFIIKDENANLIYLIDTLTHSELKFENNIDRINVLVQSMFKDTIIALNTNDISLCQNVMERDNEINKSAWLILRQMNILFERKTLKTHMSPRVLHHYGILSQYLGRIGNFAVEIAENIIKLIEFKVTKKKPEIVTQISKIGDFVLKNLDKSLKSLFVIFSFEGKRYSEVEILDAAKQANACIEDALKVPKLCEELLQIVYTDTNFIPLAFILESIIKIGDLISNVGEITLDTLALHEINL